jgi:hypothetical protein
MHFLHVVGARPNFLKVAPLMRALATRQGVRQTLVHSGQHYDQKMSDVFFRELEIPEPDFNLAVGSGTHAEQTGQIMLRFEPVDIRLLANCRDNFDNCLHFTRTVFRTEQSQDFPMSALPTSVG